MALDRERQIADEIAVLWKQLQALPTIHTGAEDSKGARYKAISVLIRAKADEHERLRKERLAREKGTP